MKLINYPTHLAIYNITKELEHEIILEHIPAHKGIKWHERADQLAKKAAIDQYKYDIKPKWTPQTRSPYKGKLRIEEYLPFNLKKEFQEDQKQK